LCHRSGCNNSFDSVVFISRNLGMGLSSSSQEDDTIVVAGQPPYRIAGLDLSSLWIDLVRQNKVSASTTLPSVKSTSKDDSDGEDQTTNTVCVEYGIRMVETSEKDTTDQTENTGWMFEEYVQQKGLESGGESSSLTPDPFVSSINATLARVREQRTNESGVVTFKQLGNYVALLQLVRTLRPPPSEGFLEATTSTPPPYNPDTDSFVTGPLRLELRPLVGRLELGRCTDGDRDKENADSNENENADTSDNVMTTPWDVFHNISPADHRGHFLLLPSLLDKKRNWRGQCFTKDDCHDLVHLTSTIEPAGSVFLGYNSVGAGASQNHIHCHMWPYPSIVSNNNDDDAAPAVEVGVVDGLGDTFQYAVTNVDKIYDFYDIFDGNVQVSYLNYPIFCIQMSSSVAYLDPLGRAVAACLEAIGESPHNIGFLNRISPIEEYDHEDEDHHDHDHEDEDTDGDGVDDDGVDDVDDAGDDESESDEEEGEQQQMVDVFIFARSKERSSFLPTLKLGISEMMGVFHAQSEAELDTLATINTVLTDDTDAEDLFERKCVMEQALADVTFENEEKLWESIVANLSAL